MKQSNSSPKVQPKKWLREASMNRLSTFMKNKTELIGNASQLGMGVIAVDDLEKSGLSPTEIYHLEQWVAGVETGRHCMLAILDERFNSKDLESASSSASSTFQPIELIKTSMNLPQDFLCDSGFVYETVFKRPPTSVIREALQMLSSKAYEKNAQGLNAHQINIAIKQLRLDHLADDRAETKSDSDSPEDGNNENISENTPRTTSESSSATPTAPVAKASEHTFRLQVMIELIRMHIISNNAKLKEQQRSSSSRSGASFASAGSTPNHNWNPAISSDSDSVSDAAASDEESDGDSDGSQDSLDELFDDLPEFIQKGLRASKPSKSHKPKKTQASKKSSADTRKNLFSKSSSASAEAKTQFARDLVSGRGVSPSPEDAAAARAAADRIDIRTLEYHLNTPLQAVAEQAESLTNEDIEYSNHLLKPYLKKMASLKGVLTTQLKDLTESRAYLCLGVTPDASDEAIKKAYRLMAIKLHPDKAGGNTAKFQQLQDHYHEILKRRQNSKTERRAFNEVRKQEKSQQRQKTAAFKSAAGLTAEDAEGELESEGELDSEDEALMSGGKGKNAKATRKSSSDSIDEEDPVVDQDSDGSASKSSNKPAKASAAPKSSSSKSTKTEIVDEDDLAEEDVEDVHISDHEDDSEIDEATGESKRELRAKAAAAEKAASQNSEYIRAKKRALKKQLKEGSYSSFTEFAQAIADSILELLVTIKQSANDITTLAQYNIKLHKAVVKISSTQPHPLSIREIMKLMKSTTLSTSTTSASSAVGGAQITSDLCSLTNAVGPIELTCELCQSICSSAMRLSSECGVHYAKQVATNRSFLATVEETMNNSLKSLKMVMQCMSSQDQFNSALRRVQDSFQLSLESGEISDLLIEMLTTALQSNVLTITNTVDRIVESTLNVSNLYELVVETIRETEHQIQQQVKREASQRESEEAENDFCEEDKELLRQSRVNQAKQQQQAQKEQAEQQQKDAENKKKNKKAEDEEEDEDENSLSNLKDKIRTLQIQLRLQHISTLQNMNKEILGLQSSIITEIKDLPFIQSWESLFKSPPAQTAASKAAAAGADKNSSSSGSDFHTSVMTLLSTLLDSSCLAIRDELKSASDLTSGHFCLRSDSHFRAVIVKHLGWTSIELNDGSKDLLTSQILNRLFPSESSPSPAGASAPPAAPSSSSYKARLAMYPEYRTKILFMASVVDVDTVKDIISCELFQRLDELLFETNGQRRQLQQQPTSPPAKSVSSSAPTSNTTSPVAEAPTVTVSVAPKESPERKPHAPVTSTSTEESFDIDCTVADVPDETSEQLYDDVDGEIFGSSSGVSPAVKSTSTDGFVHITSRQAFQAAAAEIDEEIDDVLEDKEDITGNDDSEDSSGSSYGEVDMASSPMSVEDTYEAPDTEAEGLSDDDMPMPMAASLAAEDEEEECGESVNGETNRSMHDWQRRQHVERSAW